jgi:hypothetical protein
MPGQPPGPAARAAAAAAGAAATVQVCQLKCVTDGDSGFNFNLFEHGRVRRCRRRLVGSRRQGDCAVTDDHDSIRRAAACEAAALVAAGAFMTCRRLPLAIEPQFGIRIGWSVQVRG